MKSFWIDIFYRTSYTLRLGIRTKSLRITKYLLSFCCPGNVHTPPSRQFFGSLEHGVLLTEEKLQKSASSGWRVWGGSLRDVCSYLSTSRAQRKCTVTVTTNMVLTQDNPLESRYGLIPEGFPGTNWEWKREGKDT